MADVRFVFSMATQNILRLAARESESSTMSFNLQQRPNRDEHPQSQPLQHGCLREIQDHSHPLCLASTISNPICNGCRPKRLKNGWEEKLRASQRRLFSLHLRLFSTSSLATTLRVQSLHWLPQSSDTHNTKSACVR